MALRGHIAAAPARDTKIRCLVMACGPCVLALPADWLRSILTREEAGSGDTILAAGVTYPMRDLTEHLRLPALTPSSETRVILYGNDVRQCAFAVDQVLEIVEPSRHELKPLPAQFRNAERQRLAGFFHYVDTIALIVNPVWLLDMGSQIQVMEISGGTVAHAVQPTATGMLAHVISRDRKPLASH